MNFFIWLEFDPRTGSGPSGLSPDGNQMVCRPPLAPHWADLYTTWVQAFVSQAKDFPFFIVPLLVPSVSGFHSTVPIFQAKLIYKPNIYVQAFKENFLNLTFWKM